MSIAERAAYADACALVRRFGNEIVPIGTEARLEALEGRVQALTVVAEAARDAFNHAGPGIQAYLKDALAALDNAQEDV
jgi:hypothetical protein